ncbi:MAG TPA: histidine kinase [Longimicrobiales bacterium]|nr:histidine kinase [Longimicrobiales bacterium]
MPAIMARRITAGAVTLGSVAALLAIERLLVRSGDAADSLVYIPAALALAAAAAVIAEWPRSRGWLVSMTVAVATLSLVAAFAHDAHEVPREAFWILTLEALLLFFLGLIARWASATEAPLAGILIAAAATLTLLRVTNPASPLETLGVLSAWAFVAAGPVALGLYLRAIEVRRARAVVEARRAQRLQLAHDLHDFVAHDVTAMVVQAQAAQVAAARAPEEVAASLRGIEEAGLEALGSLDRTVHTLRDAHAPGSRASSFEGNSGQVDDARLPSLEDIFLLVGRFSMTDRLPVRVEFDPLSDTCVPPAAATTAYRVVREALTNVRRHAPASTRVEVRVSRVIGIDGIAMGVTITNTVAGNSPLRPRFQRPESRPAGLGLVDLAERVEGLGGSFAAGALDDVTESGWKVSATLPVALPTRS